MKKFISLLLAVLMVMSLATTAFALQDKTNGVVDTTGTITINGASEEYTYAVYKMLHLDTYDNDNGAYIYRVETKWEAFFAPADVENDVEAGPGRAYVNIDDQGNVSWIAGADVAEFAKVALQYARDNSIAAEATSVETAFTATGYTFTGLTLGYYLVDTSMGALCGLNTTKPEAHISVKNGIPTIDKAVEEDSHVGTGTNPWGSTNNADIGQRVNFDVTINAQAGAENYVYHDDMDAGLTFIADSVVVKYHDPNLTGAEATVDLVAGTHYTLHVNPAECSIEAVESDWNCTFEIEFHETFLETIKANDKIYISYAATLNDQAVVGEPGNHNSAILEYGDNHRTEEDITTTYTYGFEIFKTDANLVPLVGAEFQLLNYDKQPMKVYLHQASGEYRVGTKALAGEVECDVITVLNANGVARVDGLDNGTYYLRETKAPNGFTLLTEDVQFIISGSNLYADRDDNGAISVGAAVHVENNKGVTLPTTGAMGTAMFITFGTIVVLGAGVLLVTKKRMGMIQD